MQPTAVVGRRVLAFVIDGLVITAINAALFFALADTDDELARQVIAGELSGDANVFVNLTLGDTTYSVTGGKAALFFLATFVLGFGYYVVLQGLRGVTLGKALTGIRLTRDDGRPAGIWRSFVRQFLWIVDSFPYLIPYLTGFLAALFSKRHKRIGDMVAGTVVVRSDSAGEPVAAAGAPAPAAAPAPAPAPEAPAQPKADWYPDPRGEKRLRYWDGQAWTDHTAD